MIESVTTKIKQLPDKTHLVTLYIQCSGVDKDALLDWMGHDGTGGFEAKFDGSALSIYDVEPKKKTGGNR